PCPPPPSLLSLHDALPIWAILQGVAGGVHHPATRPEGDERPVAVPGAAYPEADMRAARNPGPDRPAGDFGRPPRVVECQAGEGRSEEHTSELQSLTNLVCP